MAGKSSQLFAEAKKYIPGGVNSPVRAFKSVNMEPLFISKAQGSKIYDADGKEYIDYLCSWGPLILGHARPEVVEAISEAAAKGTSYGASTEAEIQLARLITEIYPSIDKVRMVNSGTRPLSGCPLPALSWLGLSSRARPLSGCPLPALS